MKALRFGKFGPLSILAIEEVARPEPRDGEALARRADSPRRSSRNSA
ncbi:MAG: hypothetical protein WCB11_09350 [Terriglobales bacterium]